MTTYVRTPILFAVILEQLVLKRLVWSCLPIICKEGNSKQSVPNHARVTLQTKFNKQLMVAGKKVQCEVKSDQLVGYVFEYLNQLQNILKISRNPALYFTRSVDQMCSEVPPSLTSLSLPDVNVGEREDLTCLQ